MVHQVLGPAKRIATLRLGLCELDFRASHQPAKNEENSTPSLPETLIVPEHVNSFITDCAVENMANFIDTMVLFLDHTKRLLKLSDYNRFSLLPDYKGRKGRESSLPTNGLSSAKKPSTPHISVTEETQAARVLLTRPLS